ncbi:MAG TPA: trehalose-phosphatase [Bryobacteraceae bacterium]|nr:trehalose-phosphatase [Bryobacteraceae bacterium]
MKSGLSLLNAVDSMLCGSGRILIASDFDGTLSPLVDKPADANLASAALTAVESVLACSRLTLAVITGRRLADIERRLPPGVIFSGNHGLEIRGGGLRFEHDAAWHLRPVIAKSCEALEAATAPWPAAWVEDKELTATLHFRKVAPEYRETLLYAARRALGAFGPKISMRAGRDALEIRPRVPWNKGSALEYIYREAGPFESCICLGDDRTDESMFRAGCCNVSVRVGSSRVTAAAYCLPEPCDVSQLFSHIAEVCGADPPPISRGFTGCTAGPAAGGSLTADHAGSGQ